MLPLRLTPELSRTDLRRGGVVHVTAQAEPRSGLGLNELLGHSAMHGQAIQVGGPEPWLGCEGQGADQALQRPRRNASLGNATACKPDPNKQRSELNLRG